MDEAYPTAGFQSLMESPQLLQMANTSFILGYPCNCTGPEPGQTKCPCQLRVQAELDQKMLREGVEIGGQRYRLVPA